MVEVGVVGLTCLVGTFVAAPIVRRWLIRSSILDIPNARSAHQVAVPRGGGLACLVGASAALAVAVIRDAPLPWPAVVAVGVVSLVGAIDDRHSLPAIPRLMIQGCVGTALGAIIAGELGAIVGAVLAPLLVNVVNFMDGINGITAVTATVWGVVAILLGHYYDAQPVMALGAVSLGTALGFLPWNVPIARLFLGDVGSYFFGMMVAASTLVSLNTSVPLHLLLAPLALQILDVILTLVRRAHHGAVLFQAHREHIYQRLLRISKRSHLSVTGLLGFGSVLVTVGVAASMHVDALFLVLPVLVAITYVSAPVIAQRLNERGPSASRHKGGS